MLPDFITPLRLLSWTALASASLSCASYGPNSPPLGISNGFEGAQTVAARFEVESEIAGRRSKSEYFVWREEDRITKHFPAMDETVVWRRHADGSVSKEHQYHEIAGIVEFFPGDLRLLGIDPDWEQLATASSPRSLGFDVDSPRRRRKTHGLDAAVFQRESGNGSTRLVWLEGLHLVAQLEQIRGVERRELELVEVHPLDRSPWPVPDASGYRKVDYADLGDLDPEDEIARFAARRNGHDH